MNSISLPTQNTTVRKHPIDIASELGETNALLMVVIATLATSIFASIALSNKEAIIDKPLICLAYTAFAIKIILVATFTIGHACYEHDLKQALIDNKS